MSSHLTQEINGSLFQTKHWSVPLQGQCSCFKHFIHTIYFFYFLLNSPFFFIYVTGLGPELEELMVEGFLLQVTLPETEQLYRYLLYKLAPLPSRSSPYAKNTEEDQSSPSGSPHKKVMINRFIPCGSYSQSHLIYNHYYGIFIITQNKDSGLKKEAMNGQSKRTKRRKDSSDSQHSEKAKKCRKKKSKKSKEKDEETKRTCSVPQTASDPAPSDSEEDYSLCAAPWCREPEGDEVCFIAVYSILYGYVGL